MELISSFNDFEKLIHHTYYNECRITSEEQPLIFADSPLNTDDNRKKIIQIFFETFTVPYLFVSTQQVLSLFAAKKTTGIVLDSGYNFTYVVPIYEGFQLQHAIIKIPYGGNTLTDFLLYRLNEKEGYEFTTTAEKDIVNNIKEKICCVSLNFDIDRFTPETKEYELPDGQMIKIGSERYECPEVLFRPEMLGVEDEQFSSVHETIVDSIKKCDSDLHSILYKNILLTGGNTSFQNFQKRFEKELLLITPSKQQIKIEKGCNYSTWKGGAAFCVKDFLKNCISKDEYEEYGPDVMCRRFPWFSS